MSQIKDILTAAQEALQRIDGTGDFETDLGDRVYLNLRGDVRTEADGLQYLEITQGLPGTRRLAANVMESGLSDQAVLRLLIFATSVAVTDGTDDDAATEQARLLEQDIRRAMYERMQLPLSTAAPGVQEQCYYVTWVDSEPIGLYLDELGRIVFVVQFDIIYAATAFLEV